MKIGKEKKNPVTEFVFDGRKKLTDEGGSPLIDENQKTLLPPVH